MDRRSACQCRGHGFDPWSEKIPHAMGQLTPCATTTEPRRLVSGFATREATAMRSQLTTTKGSLHSPQLEKAWVQRRKTQYNSPQKSGGVERLSVIGGGRKGKRERGYFLA